MPYLKAVWIMWLIAALLFFSGTGPGWLIVLLIATGFTLNVILAWRSAWRILTSKH